MDEKIEINAAKQAAQWLHMLMQTDAASANTAAIFAAATTFYSRNSTMLIGLVIEVKMLPNLLHQIKTLPQKNQFQKYFISKYTRVCVKSNKKQVA